MAVKNDLSAQALLGFLDLAAQKGWLPTTTAGVIKSNTSRVFSALDEHERADVSALDVDSALRRFANLNPQVSPQSLRDYKSRLERAIALFVAHRQDPLSFRGAEGRRKREGGTSETDRRVRQTKPRSSQSESKSAVSPSTSASLGGQGLAYPFPLRPDLTVVISNLPRDLKLAEAERLAAFFRSLTEDYKP